MEAKSQPLLPMLWAACAVLLLVAAGVFYAQGRSAASLHRESVEAGRSVQPVPTQAGGPSGSVSTAGSPGSSGSPGPSAGAGSTPRPTSGPGVDSPGTTISARLASPETIDVSESLLLAAPTTSVTISPPAVADAAKELASLAPSLTGVQVTAGGQVVPVLEDRITAPVRLDLPAPASDIEVRYLLEGGVARTVPSKAGRALAGLRPVIEATDSPVAYLFGGDEIIGVSCPELGPTAFACVAGQPGRLAVATPLRRSQSVVLLQLDLPRP